jgi:hypothetical protein
MTAAQKYLARLYERAVDSNLDTEAIRLYLAARGVLRTPAMVQDDLDNVFCFHGYHASHQPAPAQCVKEFDSAIERGKGYIQSVRTENSQIGWSFAEQSKSHEFVPT